MCTAVFTFCCLLFVLLFSPHEFCTCVKYHCTSCREYNSAPFHIRLVSIRAILSFSRAKPLNHSGLCHYLYNLPNMASPFDSWIIRCFMSKFLFFFCDAFHCKEIIFKQKSFAWIHTIGYCLVTVQDCIMFYDFLSPRIMIFLFNRNCARASIKNAEYNMN